MAGGPSKEELQMYWQNSRQYFDELANHYRQADPEYYRAHIQPFYDNPFANVQRGKQPGGGAKILPVFVFLLVLAIGAAGAAYFIFRDDLSTETKKLEKIIGSDDEQKVREIEPGTEKEKKELKTPDEEEDSDGMTSDDHFIVGSKKIAEQDYDKAEYHLKKVKPGTEYYEQSKELLKNMKYLRKYRK